MDAIFEDSSEEVGAEIEAYCPSPRCKADTTHTIISMYEDEIRRVQCVVCGEVHAFRKPRGDGPEDTTEPAKPAPAKRMNWQDAMGRATEADLGNCRPYSIRDTYELGDVVHHPMFDIGFVVELLPDNKVDVVFREAGSRILVHNRGDLAARMPDISEIPIPREAKKKKRAKKVELVEAPLVVRSKADVESAVQKARTSAQARVDAAQEATDERNKRLKAEAKAIKPVKSKSDKPVVPVEVVVEAETVKAAVVKAKAQPSKAPVAKPAAAAAKKPVKAAPPAKAAKAVVKKPLAKPVAKKPAAKPVAKKPMGKPAKPVAKVVAKKAAKPVAKKPAKKKK
jgi:hypothetical protein